MFRKKLHAFVHMKGGAVIKIEFITTKRSWF